MDIDGTTTHVSTDQPLATQYGGFTIGTPHTFFFNQPLAFFFLFLKQFFV
jgi:hypothetical protein